MTREPTPDEVRRWLASLDALELPPDTPSRLRCNQLWHIVRADVTVGRPLDVELIDCLTNATYAQYQARNGER